MTAMDFPNTPTPGQIYAPPGGPVYRFEDDIWSTLDAGPPVIVSVPSGIVWAPDFGVELGTAADQSVALQAAIDYAETTKANVLLLPVGYIRIDHTIYVGRIGPIRIEGGTHVNTVSGSTVAQHTSLRCDALPIGDVAIDIGKAAANLNAEGVSLHGLTIYRAVAATAGTGGIGILMRGVFTPELENVLISGFDINWKITHTDDGVIPTAYGSFYNVRSRLAATACLILEMNKASLFEQCDFSGGLYGMKIVTSSNPGVGSSDVQSGQFFYCKFIGTADTGHVNNVHIVNGFNWMFDHCDFEEAQNENVFIDIGGQWGTSIHVINAVFNSCQVRNDFPNNKGAASLNNCNFQIEGGQYYTGGTTDATIKINKVNPIASTMEFRGSTITMANITWRGATAGVDAANSTGLLISGNIFNDANNLNTPCVIFGSDVQRSSVIGNYFRTDHATGWTVGAAGLENRFHHNILKNGDVVDEYRLASLGGPVQSPLGLSARQQMWGTGSIDTGRASGRYSNDATGPFELQYRSRATTVGGARAAVQSGDDILLRRYAIDDGTADVEVVRELVEVDAVTGGRWALYTRPTGGSLAQRLIVDQAGNIVTGVAALATTATDGFLYIPGCAGVPTGVPTTKTGQVPLCVNTTANKLMFYSGGAWRDAGP